MEETRIYVNGSVKSMSGGINVKGNVEGNASSMSGSVIVNKIKF